MIVKNTRWKLANFFNVSFKAKERLEVVFHIVFLTYVTLKP